MTNFEARLKLADRLGEGIAYARIAMELLEKVDFPSSWDQTQKEILLKSMKEWLDNDK